MVNKITTPPTQNEVIDKINELVDGKQDTLVSGTNIKTINNTSILGSGNITISGGSTYTAGTGIDITNSVISVTSAISNGATGNVKLNGGSSQQTISLTSGTGTTALGVKSMSGSSYISFNGSSGWLASFGIGSDKKPTIYDGSSHTIAYTTDIPTNNNQLTNGAGYITGIPYGESTSAADAVQKEVTISEITELKTGQIIIVKPTITSTVADATLKLNSFVAYPMLYGAAAITTSTDSITWAANYPSWFRFDGSNWVFLGHGVDNNTTYTAMSVSEGTTGTATTSRVMRADRLKSIIQGTKLTGLSTSTNSAVTASDTILVGVGKLQAQVNAKQATLVSGTNIKTVGGTSLLGSGNIALPTVNNATLTIQKNGSNVATFTANASSNVTANISVPNTVSSVSSSSTNADAVGAKLFYDTCGDIETAINTIRGV